MPSPSKARIVTAMLRDGDRILLCHRSPQRRYYPDVWDFPGGHIDPGETPEDAVARELAEELAITVEPPSAPPAHEIHTDTFDMRIWLFDSWTGTPANVAPEEHDAISWFTVDELDGLDLAHPSYPELITRLLAG